MRKTLTITIGLILAQITVSGWARAERIDGFTEPYKTVEIATTEIGIINSLHVRQGDSVSEGDVLATLDSDVQQALLSIANKNRELQGRLRSSQAELKLRKQRLEQLISLRESGHARREEVERARADLSIANAQVLAAEEELAVRQLEYEKAAINLARRQIRCPLNGVISVLLKEEGEFVAPTDPHILHIVQLQQLLAVFSVPSHAADGIQLGMQIDVAVAGDVLPGTVEQVAPLTDAESDTVRIKLRLDNEQETLRSGLRCSLLLPELPQETP